mgnify:CR=1 FL=1
MTRPLTGTSIRIRTAEPDDIRPLAELWCDAFPGKRTVAERIRMLEHPGRFGGLEHVLVAADEHAGVVGACKALHMTQYIAGVAMPMMGLAAVAVAPDWRRQGLGERLCVAAVELAADRGDVLSALYPFRPDYYRRLGWGLVGGLHEYRIRTDAIQAGRISSHIRDARLERDTEAIAACYRRVAVASNGPLERDRHIWAYQLEGVDLGAQPVDADALWTARAEPAYRVVVHDDGDVTGYALLRGLRQDTSAHNTLEVRELVAESDTAYLGLLAHIAAQWDRWPRTHYCARPDELFPELLKDPRPPRFREVRSLYFPTARIVRGPMLRLVDVPGALRLRRFFDTGQPRTATLAITVSDEQRPENRGPWTVRLDAEGAAEVEENGDGDPDAALDADAATLARIFAGELAPGRAARLGRARVDGDATLLDRAFAARERFWLLDEF